MTDDDLDRRSRREAQWEKYGVEAIEADLINGGFRLVGGPPETREHAWEWVRRKKAEAKQVKLEDTVTATPGIFGFSVDLKQVWKWFRGR